VLRSRSPFNLRSSASARGVFRPRERNAASASGCAHATARRPPRAATYGKAHAPASVGAGRGGVKIPLAREGRSLAGVPARRIQVAEVDKRHRRVQRSAHPAGSGSREREPGAPNARKGTPRAARASTTVDAVAKPRRRPKAEAGRSKERCGAKVLVRRKAPRPVSSTAPVHTDGRGAGLADFAKPDACKRKGGSEGRDRGARGSACTRCRGKTRTSAATQKVRPAEAHRPEVRQAVPGESGSESSRLYRSPRGVGARIEGEMAEVGPTHRVSCPARSRKANRPGDTGQGATRITC
jgi:hypothetical protein